MSYRAEEIQEQYDTLKSIHGFDKFLDGKIDFEKMVDIDNTAMQIAFKKARIKKSLKIYGEMQNYRAKARWASNANIAQTEKELEELLKELKILLR